MNPKNAFLPMAMSSLLDDGSRSRSSSSKVRKPTSSSPNSFGTNPAGIAGLPEVPAIPEVPGMAGMAGVPEVPVDPGRPGVPGVPGTAGMACVPGRPGVPGVPETSGMTWVVVLVLHKNQLHCNNYLEITYE